MQTENLVISQAGHNYFMCRGLEKEAIFTQKLYSIE